MLAEALNLYDRYLVHVIIIIHVYGQVPIDQFGQFGGDLSDRDKYLTGRTRVRTAESITVSLVRSRLSRLNYRFLSPTYIQTA